MEDRDLEITKGISEVADGVRRTDDMLFFLGEYNYDSEIAALRSEVSTSAQLILNIGCRLLRLKEHEPRGRFQQACLDVGLEPRQAQRFMSCALRFVCSDTGKVKYPQLLQQNASKIYELSMLDDEDLEALEGGSSVSGITLDDVDRMSTRELRKTLRDARTDKEAYEAVVKKKDEVINGLELQLAQAETRKKGLDEDEIRAISESLQSDILECQTDGNVLLSKFRVIMGTLRDADPSDPSERALYRAAWETLVSAVSSLGTELERLQEEIGSTVPESERVDAGYDSMARDGYEIVPHDEADAAPLLGFED